MEAPGLGPASTEHRGTRRSGEGAHVPRLQDDRGGPGAGPG